MKKKRKTYTEMERRGLFDSINNERIDSNISINQACKTYKVSLPTYWSWVKLFKNKAKTTETQIKTKTLPKISFKDDLEGFGNYLSQIIRTVSTENASLKKKLKNIQELVS